MSDFTSKTIYYTQNSVLEVRFSSLLHDQETAIHWISIVCTRVVTWPIIVYTRFGGARALAGGAGLNNVEKLSYKTVYLAYFWLVQQSCSYD